VLGVSYKFYGMLLLGAMLAATLLAELRLARAYSGFGRLQRRLGRSFSA
jgi:hypothetical protein